MAENEIPEIPLIEKLARDLCMAQRIDPDAPVMVDMKTVKAWESRVKQVRVVLEGVRTPTPEMVTAGVYTDRLILILPDDGEQAVQHIWRDMIGCVLEARA